MDFAVISSATSAEENIPVLVDDDVALEEEDDDTGLDSVGILHASWWYLYKICSSESAYVPLLLVVVDTSEISLAN